MTFQTTPLVRNVTMTVPQMRRRQACINGEVVRLTPSQHRLLTMLLLRGPLLTTKEELTEMLWPDADDQPDYAWNCCTVYITKLRQKGVLIGTQNARGWSLLQYHGGGWGKHKSIGRRGRWPDPKIPS